MLCTIHKLHQGEPVYLTDLEAVTKALPTGLLFYPVSWSLVQHELTHKSATKWPCSKRKWSTVLLDIWPCLNWKDLIASLILRRLISSLGTEPTGHFHLDVVTAVILNLHYRLLNTQADDGLPSGVMVQRGLYKGQGRDNGAVETWLIKSL